mmetsp:Transcript_35021/g.90943  ORF Transcript_35021/g.90943 Transcript_35021/m.90943 type:complete len:216 (+) Transcript_35021:897-1544(+)
MENSTPPMGAPKAAARPHAVPAEMNSRWSVSSKLWHSRQRWSCCTSCAGGRPASASRLRGLHKANLPRMLQFSSEMAEAMQAPMWTIGPSGPTARLAAHPQTVPPNLNTSVLKLSRLGMKLPLRYAITGATPAPAADGQNSWTAAPAVPTSATLYITCEPQASSRLCFSAGSSSSSFFQSRSSSVQPPSATATTPVMNPVSRVTMKRPSVRPVYP